MEWTILLGFICAFFVGISLGLIGGGGSILAVPIFAYLFELDAVYSTAYSLFVVGTIALFGSVQKHRQGFVNWRIAMLFGVPAIFAVFIMRRIFIPALPENLFHISDFQLTKRMAMFGMFAVLMALSAVSMLQKSHDERIPGKEKINIPLLIMQGLMLGFLTGFVGAGGGFLIIPALMLMANLDIRTAIGTSLVIITMNSLMGFFLGDAWHLDIDWSMLLTFAAIALVGMLAGNWIGMRVKSSQLRTGFAYVIISMAFLIFYQEFIR